MTKKLLVVEDERDVGALIAKAGRLAGYSVQLASRPQTFKTLLESFHPDVVIMDLQIPGEDGIELLGHLSGVNKPISVIINSGMDQSVIESARAVADSYKLNVIGTLQKPFSIKELVGLLNISSAAQAEITRDGLITALQEDQFEIHYQPKIFLHNVKGPAAGEALLRWRHPELGMVSPAVFIEMFEQADLMRPLTELVVNKIAKQMHAWEKAGIMPDIAINISPDTLKETDFPDALHKIIAMEGIDPRRVTLEITESMNIVHQSHCIEVLSRLRIKGFGVSLDDFGIGYSSLQRLYQLPVNEIKIDRMFIRDLGKSENADKIVTALINLISSLDKSCCAEGVETPMALKKLISLGCDSVQGHLLSEPLPAATFADYCQATAGCSFNEWLFMNKSARSPAVENKRVLHH